MDYYSVLGVDKNASASEIKKAFRKLAMENHPDRTGGDDTKFKQINEAYDTLKDPDKKSAYDNPQASFRSNDFSQGYGNFNDIFSQMFRQQRTMRKNADVTIVVTIDLLDVKTGKDIIGRYRLRNGKDEVANIRIPKGIEHGQIIRFQGMGDNSVPNLPRGDLNVQVQIKKHRIFERDRLHLRTKCVINVFDCLLGTEILVEGLGGERISVKVPKGTNPGTILSIPGYGLPEMNTGRSGNLYVELKVTTPLVEDFEQIEMLENIYNGINTISK